MSGVKRKNRKAPMSSITAVIIGLGVVTHLQAHRVEGKHASYVVSFTTGTVTSQQVKIKVIDGHTVFVKEFGERGTELYRNFENVTILLVCYGDI
jgi:hypothetical protein